MKSKALMLLLFVLIPTVASAVPTQVPYSCQLSEGGTLVNGTRAMTLVIYDAAAGGSALYTQNEPSVAVTNGVYHTELNAPSTVWTGADRWLGVSVNGGAELTPRTKIGSVPYAVRAGTAEALVGPVFRIIRRAHGLGPNNGTDQGAIESRVLTFTKTQDATGIRVSYVDNHRVYNYGACRWEIRFNGVQCPTPGPIAFDYYFGGLTGMDIHRSDASFGTCFGLPAGTYTIQVYVGPTPGFSVSDCYTGWKSQYWSLEAEEVF